MELPPLAPNRLEAAQDAMRRAAAEVIEIHDVTLGPPQNPLRLRGRLLMPADQAFARLRPQFEAVGHTPLLRREEGMDEIRALPTVFGTQPRRPPTLALTLLALTVISVFLVGVQQDDGLFNPPWAVIIAQITGNTSALPFPDLMPTPEVWRHALTTGALYTLSLLGILGAHEMGHYIVARIHKVHTSVPFFIPMPFNILGTLGAVIAMREPAPNRRIQFDIGIAGPLAGLIVAVPVMLYGLTLSEVGDVQSFMARLPEAVQQNTAILHEGQSLAYLALKYLVFGRILPQGGVDVWIHPVAFAAWAGFLVTALNLLPIGQLDGGHVMFGLFGRKARAARTPVIAALLIMATIGSLRDMAAGLPPGAAAGALGLLRPLADLPLPGWSGWWIWIFFALFLLRSHAPVLDEITELDGPRKALGVVMLVVFILVFSPTPLVIEANPVAALLRLFT